MKRITKHIAFLKLQILKLPQRTLLILICILIGIVSGISAFILKSVLEYVHGIVRFFGTSRLSNILLVTLPISGLFFTVLYFLF